MCFCFRETIPFINAVVFFQNDEIPTNSNLENIFDMFENVYKFYSNMLRKSITEQIDVTLTRTEHTLYYNYLIVNGTKLNEILKEYESLSLDKKELSTI